MPKADKTFIGSSRDACTVGQRVEVMDNEQRLNRLRHLRGKIDWNIKEERKIFLYQLYKLIHDWEDRFPNIREILSTDEIKCLLSELMSHYPHEQASNYPRERFIEIVIQSGYKDEPELDEAGRPVLLRDTILLQADRSEYGRFLVPLLFKIFYHFDVNYRHESGYSHFHVGLLRRIGGSGREISPSRPRSQPPRGRKISTRTVYGRISCSAAAVGSRVRGQKERNDGAAAERNRNADTSKLLHLYHEGTLYNDEFSLKVVASSLAILDMLEEHGAEVDESVVDEFKGDNIRRLFEKMAAVAENWYKRPDLRREAERITVKSGLSLYRLLQLPYHEAEELRRRLTYMEFWEFARLDKLNRLPQQYRENCALHLIKTMSLGYLQRWDIHQYINHHPYRYMSASSISQPPPAITAFLSESVVSLARSKTFTKDQKKNPIL
ncbi:unnamed protein product [Trichogramma brassicae]|uniref:Uncharacterized protein n=1 Tax=Trichogramma brassicae TaxID=86971 RepID=A0A6H5IVJ8_9HYME|nr:unnamed protein product [Trichogramma brassicae]